MVGLGDRIQPPKLEPEGSALRVLPPIGGETSVMHVDTKNERGALRRFYERLEAYMVQRASEFGQISQARKEEIAALVEHVRKCLEAKEPVRLNFICTHNSRRSQISQIWAAAAAARYGVPDVRTYSGGTEATAFNPRAVAALQRAGFMIRKTTEDENPVYHVYMHDDATPMTACSKRFNDAPNPRSGFCAVLTCAQADKACPSVAGASARVAIPYDDPKAFDGTPEESAKYDERCRQISREMLFVFSQIRGLM